MVIDRLVLHAMSQGALTTWVRPLHMVEHLVIYSLLETSSCQTYHMITVRFSMSQIQ